VKVIQEDIETGRSIVIGTVPVEPNNHNDVRGRAFNMLRQTGFMAREGVMIVRDAKGIEKKIGFRLLGDGRVERE
jgi:hypothetical protein